mgnify:CR=1 FL=1
MKKMIPFAWLVLSAILYSCNNNNVEKENAVGPAPKQKVVDIKLTQLSSEKDFVCGMPLEEGSITDTTSYKEKIYGFCSAECKAEFLKNPQTYLSQK